MHRPWEFSVDRGIPCPRPRVGEIGRLHGHHQREVACDGTARSIDGPVDNGLHLRERRVEAVGRGRVDLDEVQEFADASPERCLLINDVREAKPRLQAVFWGRREAVRKPVIQALEVREIGELRNCLVAAANRYVRQK